MRSRKRRPHHRAKSKSASSRKTPTQRKPATYKCTPHETLAERTKITTNPEIRSACWSKLPIVHDLPSKYRDVFKVDMYGNVVAKAAEDGALCFFDVDHVFPWSRGGRSVMANFQAVQCFANRSVKSDRLHPTISDEEICVGLTLDELKGLLELREGRGRNSKRKHDDLMAWLCNTPMKGRSLGAGFRREVSQLGGDAAKLFRWFLKRQHEDQELLYGDYDDDAAEPVELLADTGGKSKEKDTKKARPKDTRRNSSAATKRDEAGEHIVGSKPSIGFRVTATALELSGTKTFAVKDNILKPLSFRWDHRKKLWWIPIESQAAHVRCWVR